MSTRTPDLLRGKRVTVVLNWAFLGGAERRALEIARWLKDERGAEVDVLALTERDGRAVELARTLGIPWGGLEIAWDGRTAAKVRELAAFVDAVRERRPHVLMSYCSLPNVLCGLTWRLTGAATCVWYQADVSPFKRARPSTKRFAARRAPVLVANAEHTADHLVREWSADRERIRVVRAGVEPPHPAASREEWRARLGLDEDDFVACMVAHFRISKDHATLVRAWRTVADELASDGRRSVLLLVGDGYPMLDSVKALAFDLHLDGSVRFPGEVADVYGLVGASDLGVMSSYREGYPVALLECMASGLPVCGSDIAGIREVVGAEGSEFLAPTADADALAAAILRLARDRALRARVGAANRERVLVEHSPERLHERYEDVLGFALGSGRPERARSPIGRRQARGRACRRG